jgi:hypothetical protein
MTSSVSAVRSVAILLVLGAVPGALWAGGYLPPPESPKAPVQGAADPGLVEAEWRDRVEAICGWERKRVRAIAKAFRRAASPADALLAFDSTIRLGRTSLEIFRRLNTPFAFQREVRELKGLLEREQRALVALRDALRAGNPRAFSRHAQEIVLAEGRKRVHFADLGLRGCLPPARAPFGESGTSPV